MITLNEAHNMEAALDNIADFSSEIFVVDSFSSDDTVDIALRHGAHVVQRRFSGFGDQWNFALRELPVTAPWTMKLDPDERLTPDLKRSIRAAIAAEQADAFIIRRRLWFMGRPLPVHQDVLRLWRTGTCKFSDVPVNEQPIVDGRTGRLAGDIEHHDSPDLHHWFDKQNRYSTAEATMAFEGHRLAAEPNLFGNHLERRMFLKALYRYVPFRHALMYLYCLIWLGSWRAGRAGRTWARLRALVFRMREDKLAEMRLRRRAFHTPAPRTGTPNTNVRQFE